jgi:hypothetical protein
VQLMMGWDAERLSDQFALRARVWIGEGADPEVFANGRTLPPSRTDSMVWRDSGRGSMRSSRSLTRKEFAFARIGQGWTSETVIVTPAQDLFADNEVLHHHWPARLCGRVLGTD